MMKTPEEIKKGLEACIAGECHTKRHDCPYREEGECTLEIMEDALACIQQLEAAQPKWISVEERLPEVENENNTFKSTEDVLAVDKDGNIYAGYFRIYKFDGTTEFCGVEFDYYRRVQPVVTHWMPLPLAPDDTTTPNERS